MVKLNKIYTKTGDDGRTGLVGGVRVQKDDPRVEAYGTVDEANSFIGFAITQAHSNSRLAEILRLIQNDLFDLGADLATPVGASETPDSALRITSAQTLRLEQTIDDWNAPIPPLESFVLPGGSTLASALHMARTVTRRAERMAVTLRESNPDFTNAEPIRYLNRLSDLLFVLARAANDNGRLDVLWKPGAGRKT